ncbi:MAG TPA: DUF2304 domain-containing protein [Thermoanaerobaculia bacterium]|jgi:hypothetical protein|nr:DUF2304 domain-containing protein [Thermoanaerobaculia bacterium]
MSYQLRVQLIAVFVSLGFAVLVIDLVRRRKLNEWYSLLWLATGAVVTTFAVFRGLQFRLAEWVGLYYPPVLILAVVLALLLGITLYLSVVLTRFEARNRRLTQRLALLELEVRGLAGAAAKPPSDRTAPPPAGEQAGA